jgi:hypothetical protein
MRYRALTVSSASLFAASLASAALVARPAPADLRAEIERILAQPEYRRAQGTWLQGLIKRLVEWLRDVFGDWSPQVVALKEAWPVLYWVVTGLLILVAAVLLYHIGYTLSLMFRDRRPRPRPAPGRPAADPDALRAQAAELAAQGRYAEAAAALYEALIRHLDRQGILRHDDSRTNGEYLEAVRGRPPLAEAMAPLTRWLDPVLYGNAALSETDYATCEGLVEQAWAAGGEDTP